MQINIKKNKFFFSILIIFTLCFVTLHFNYYDSKQQHGSDSLENLAGSYSIAKFNTYAIYSLDDNIHPSAAREPLFPFTIGLIIKATNLFVDSAHGINAVPTKGFYDHFYRGLTIQNIKKINKLKIANIVLLYFTILLATYFVFNVTKNYYLVIYNIVTLLCSFILVQYAHTFLTEIFSAFFCLWVTILLYYYDRFSSKNYFGLTLGIALSCLVLTKAIYLYFVPIVFLYLFLVHKKNHSLNRIFFLNLFSLALVLGCCVGGWMVRNYIDFDRFLISNRRAETFMYRAAYNKVTNKEYFYLYAFATPGLSKYFTKKETEQDWIRVYNQSGNEPLIYETYNQVYMPFLKDKEALPNNSYSQADYLELENKSLTTIIHHPLQHLKLSLFFFYRSLFIDDGNGFRFLGIKLPQEPIAESRTDNILLGILVNIPFWIGFFYMLSVAIRNKDMKALGLILLPLYTLIMYCCVAYSYPRYMAPLIPILTILFCVSIKKMMSKFNFASVIKQKSNNLIKINN